MTTRGPRPPDDDPEEVDGLSGHVSKPGQAGEESFVQRLGLTGLLGGIAATITAAAALVSVFNSRHDQPSDAPLNPPAVAFNIADYWYGTPANASQPLIFHLLVNEPPTDSGRTVNLEASSVFGTVRNPCASGPILTIESGTWNDGHLIVHVSVTESGKPLTLDVFREAQELTGSLKQSGNETPITLHRGETGCPK